MKFGVNINVFASHIFREYHACKILHYRFHVFCNLWYLTNKICPRVALEIICLISFLTYMQTITEYHYVLWHQYWSLDIFFGISSSNFHVPIEEENITCMYIYIKYIISLFFILDSIDHISYFWFYYLYLHLLSLNLRWSLFKHNFSCYNNAVLKCSISYLFYLD